LICASAKKAPLWPLEAVNGLLPITIDDEATRQVWTATAELAEQFRLSAYDAAYLEGC